MRIRCFFLALILSTSSLFCFAEHTSKMHLTRVILTVSDNPDHLSFWPIMAKSWSQFTGVIPTLIVVGNREDVKVDESLGEVFYFDPIRGYPTSYQARATRLLFPSLFRDDVCIILDIDQASLNSSYFSESLEKYDNNCLVLYQEFINTTTNNEFVNCCIVGKGSIFQEIFGVRTLDEIQLLLTECEECQFPLHRSTIDQYLLHDYVTNWIGFPNRIVRLSID